MIKCLRRLLAKVTKNGPIAGQNSSNILQFLEHNFTSPKFIIERQEMNEEGFNYVENQSSNESIIHITDKRRKCPYLHVGSSVSLDQSNFPSSHEE